jgi:hypothetical protein
MAQPPSPLPSIPEISSLEEVAEPILSGKILGESQRVTSVILFGPDSLTTVRDQVVPDADGTYSFKLPPPGRYRIVTVGDRRTTLSCRPAFQSVLVGEYGFLGLDFRVLGVVGGGGAKPKTQ